MDTTRIVPKLREAARYYSGQSYSAQIDEEADAVVLLLREHDVLKAEVEQLKSKVVLLQAEKADLNAEMDGCLT